MMIEKIKNLLKFNRNSKAKTVQDEIDEMFDTLGVDTLKITVGEDLVPFAQDLVASIKDLRKKIKSNTGLIIPQVRILDSTELQENEYKISIQGKTVFTGFTVPKEDYAVNEITTNLEKECFKNVELVLSNELTEKYIETVQRTNGWLICYLSRLIPPTGIKIILSDLIKNGKSINNINYIFEKICEVATKDQDIYKIRDARKIAKEVNLEIK